MIYRKTAFIEKQPSIEKQPLTGQTLILELKAGNDIKHNDISPIAFFNPRQSYRRLVVQFIGTGVIGQVPCLAHKHLGGDAASHARLISERDRFQGSLVMHRGAAKQNPEARIGRQQMGAKVRIGYGQHGRRRLAEIRKAEKAATQRGYVVHEISLKKWVFMSYTVQLSSSEGGVIGICRKPAGAPGRPMRANMCPRRILEIGVIH